MKIKVQKIDFTKEIVNLGDNVLFIEINGIQISIKDKRLMLKSNDSLVLEPCASNVVLINEKNK